MAQSWPIACKTSAQLIGWLVPVACTVAIGVGLLLATSTGRQENIGARVVEVIVPLAFAVQAGFLLSPDDDPALELMVACPRPLAWVMVERLAALSLLLGGVALFGNLAAGALLHVQNLPLAFIRWLAPCTFVGGVALFTTQVTRHGVFGALLAILLWGGMLFGWNSLLARWPFLWPLHAYLQPETVFISTYAINRSVLILIGFGLMALSGRLLEDDERVLGLRSMKAAK